MTQPAPAPAPAREARDEPASQPAARPPAHPARRSNAWVSFGRWATILSVTGIATWIAGSGQIGVWAWADLPGFDTRRFGMPFLMELAVVAWLFIGKYAASKCMSPYPWWGVASAFATIAVYTNCVHVTSRQALIFGTASALTIALWFVHFYLDYAGDEINAERRSGARPKVLFTFATVFDMPLRWRAFRLVSRFAQITSVEQALTLSDMWRWVYQDTKVGCGRRVARRTAWHAVARELGIKVIQPQGIEIAEVTFAEPVPAPAPRAPRPPAITAPAPDRRTPPVDEWASEARTGGPSNAPTSPAPVGTGSRKQDTAETYKEIVAELDAMRADENRGWKGDVPTDGEMEAAAIAVHKRTGAAVPSKGTRVKIRREVFVARMEAIN